jgi:hypothetical protein
MRKIKKFIPILLLLFIFLVRELSVINKTSIIDDETVHIFSGYSIVKTHTYSSQSAHPPLCKILAGLAILHLHPRLPSFIHRNFNRWIDGEWIEGEHFFFKNKSEINQILFWARLPIVFLAIILGLFIFLWSNELYGYYAGLFSLFLFTFDPNILANSGLVTTDLGVSLFIFITIYIFYKYLSKPGKLLLGLFGLSLGLALATKFTTPVLVPPALLLICLFLLTRKEYKDRIPIIKKQVFSLYGLLSIIIIPLFVLSAFYMFIHTGDFFRGLYNIVFAGALIGNHVSFLNGVFSMNGFRAYFIFAFLYKTPIAFIIMFLLTLFFIEKIEDREYVLFIPVIILFILGAMSKLQLGIRYILPIYPFLYVFAGKLVPSIMKRQWKWKIIVSGLIIWYGWTSIMISPNYISYFNRFAQGPNNGWKYLIDSNIDWGQDLKGLKVFLKENGNPPVILSYFGSIDPTIYGIKYQPLLMAKYPDARLYTNTRPQKEYLAVSVNNLQGLMFPPQLRDIFNWLKPIQPVAKAGYSIFIYNITDSIYIREHLYDMYMMTVHPNEAKVQQETVNNIILQQIHGK